MKRIFTFLVAALITASVFAQSPEKMSYQAVIRNSSDALVTNTQVGIQISILQGSASGTIVYSEVQSPTTNANGLLTIEIGGGVGFDTINWANGPYFLKTETDPTGGSTYTITGTSQLLSVPYALHAKTAGSITGGITETDPVFGASVASSITGADTTNWNNHFSGNYNALSNLPDTLWSHTDSTVYLKDTANFVGLGTKTPLIKLDLKADQIIGTSEMPVSQHDSANIGTKVSFGAVQGTDISEFSGMRVLVDTGSNGCGNSSDIVFDTWECNTASSREVLRINGSGNVGIGTSTPQARLDIVGNIKISDGTEGDGKVLTSDASGNASWKNLGFAIGDSYGGGIIFWLDATGQHGLIAATVDQSTGVVWNNGTYITTNAVRDGIGAGMYNTERIIANQSTGSYAAQLCANYQGGGYGDWYLPSKDELNLLYAQKTAVGGFANAYYWSSTEFVNAYAWRQDFYDGYQTYNYTDYTSYVRAIRAF